mgnify:CR=1 FL=1
MLLINNVNLHLDTDFLTLQSVMEGYLKTPLKSAQLYKKSVDARHKNNVHFCCSVLVSAENETKAIKRLKNAVVYNENGQSIKSIDDIDFNNQINIKVFDGNVVAKPISIERKN